MTTYNKELVPHYPRWLETRPLFQATQYLTILDDTIYKLNAITYSTLGHRSRVYLESMPLTDYHYNVNEGDRDALSYPWTELLIKKFHNPRDAGSDLIEDIKQRLESYLVVAVL